MLKLSVGGVWRNGDNYVIRTSGVNVKEASGGGVQVSCVLSRPRPEQAGDERAAQYRAETRVGTSSSELFRNTSDASRFDEELGPRL